jgi:hypothetical protein
LLEIKGAKCIRPDFFIEIVESKVIENSVLVQQIIEFLWVFSVYPSHPQDFTLKNLSGQRPLMALPGIKDAKIESSYDV